MQQNQQNYPWKVGELMRSPSQNYPNRQFRLVKEIGKGTEGIIYLAESQNFDKTQTCALKIHFTSLKKDYLNFLDNIIKEQNQCEQNILDSNQSSQYIIRIYDAFENNLKQMVIVMEVGSQDLYEFLNKNQSINLQTISNYCIQMSKAVQYLHQNNFIHRDLKSENFIFIGQQIKMIDFGQIKHNFDPFKTGYIGSLLFQAPEIMLGSNEYTSAVDIWSLGCAFYEMIKREPIFNFTECNEILKCVQKHMTDQTFVQNKINQLLISDIWKETILQMLHPSADKRPTIQAVLQKLEQQTINKTNFQINNNNKFPVQTQNFMQNYNVFQQINNLIITFQNQNTLMFLQQNNQTKYELQRLIEQSNILLNKLFSIDDQNQSQQKYTFNEKSNIQEKIEFVEKIIKEIQNDSEYENKKQQYSNQIMDQYVQIEFMQQELKDPHQLKEKINKLEQDIEILQNKIQNSFKDTLKQKELEIKKQSLENLEQELILKKAAMNKEKVKPTSIQQLITNKENEIKKIQQEIFQFQLDKSKLEFLEQSYQKNLETLAQLEKELSEKVNLEKEVQEQNGQILRLENDTKDLKQLISKSQNCNKKLGDLQIQIQDLNNKKNTLLQQNDEMERSKIQLKYLNNEIENIKKVNLENEKLFEELNLQRQNFEEQYQKGKQQLDEIKNYKLQIRDSIDLLENQNIDINNQLKLAQMSEETLKNLTQEVEQKKQLIIELDQKKMKIQEMIKEKNDLDDQIKLQQFKDKPQNLQFQFPQNQFNQQSLNKSFPINFQQAIPDQQNINQTTKQLFPFKDSQKPK